MKRILVILALLHFGYANAQEIELELATFDQVKVYNGLQVTLNKSDENRVLVTGESKEQVKFLVENGILKIRMNLDNIWKEDNTRIDIFYTDLIGVEAKQNSWIKFDDPVEQESFFLEAQEGSKIFAEIDALQLTSKAFSGGEIEVSGEAQKQDIDIRAGGKFYGGNLRSKNVIIRVSAGGVGDVHSSNYVDTKVRAGGTVNVYGNPELIDKNILFGGKIQRKN